MKFSKKIIIGILILIILLLEYYLMSSVSRKKNVEIVNQENNIVDIKFYPKLFEKGLLVKTTLKDKIKYHGTFSILGESPYIIYSGTPCINCDVSEGFYIHQISKQTPKIGPLIPPGEEYWGFGPIIVDGEEKDLFITGIYRAFYGEVLPNIEGVIWFVTKFNEYGVITEDFSFLFQILKNGETKEITLFGNKKNDINLVLKLNTEGKNSEIQGTRYPTPL